MGAYLYYKLENKQDAKKALDYLLEESKVNNKLMELEEQHISIVEPDSIIWAIENEPHMVDYYTSNLGKGDIKTSGGLSNISEIQGFDEDDILEMQCKVFEELNERFEMRYFSNSCALSEDGAYYFTLNQMKRFTQNGKLLSGKTSKSDRARELYSKYYKAFSEPEKELFDINDIGVNDMVLINDRWTKVEHIRFGLRVQTGINQWDKEDLEDVISLIEGHKKYVPTILYNGASADIEKSIIHNGTLIYLELVGQETMIKSVTSVLMQGRVKMNDHDVRSDKLGHFSINKAGNKRKMIPLSNGIAHAILYHSPSVKDVNFNIIIGRDDKEILASFAAWMEKSQPLPYPKELTTKIYEKLVQCNKIEDLDAYNMKAVSIDIKILEDDYYDLQNIIIDVCKENGLIDPNAKPIRVDAPLPKSRVLTEKQVQKIFDTLKKMPKTYELEDVKIKPIGLKLFSSNMTLFITEADAGCESDEFLNEHTQCYGYIKNESDPHYSEWGYINVRDYIEAGNGLNYFEQDLHFENKYINLNGKVGTLEELENKIAA